MSLGVILPVSECTLIFFMASLSCVVTTEFGGTSHFGLFLSRPEGLFAVSRARARVGQFRAVAAVLTVLVCSSSFSVFGRFQLSFRELLLT